MTHAKSFRLLDVVREPCLLVSGDGAITAVNAAAQELLGAGMEPGVTTLPDLAVEAPDRLAAYLHACAGSGAPLPGVVTLRLPGGPVRFRCHGLSMRSADPEADGGVVLRLEPWDAAARSFLALNQKIEELTREARHRRRIEQALRDSERRTRFLAEASRLLALTLEDEATLANVARHAVPEIADWCAVDLVDEAGAPRRVALAHRDTTDAEHARGSDARRAHDLEPPGGAVEVLRTGRAALVAEVPDALLEAAARDEQHLAQLRSLKLGSWIIAPLRGRDRTLGTITVVYAESGRRHTAEDLRIIEDLARRAAVAIENARLYEAEQDARRSANAAAERTSRLQALTAALSESVTPQQVAEALLREGMAAWDAVAGGVTLVTPDGHAQVAVAVDGPGVDPDQLTRWQTFALDEPYPVNDCVTHREIITLDSFEMFEERYPEIARHIGEAGYQAYFAVPIELNGRAIGCANFNFAERRTFSAADRSFMVSMARQASQAFERARLYDIERQAREAAEHANQVKTRFLSVMSHELRTPLNAIIGYHDLLDSGIAGELNETQVSHLGRIRSAAHSLLRLIDHILSLSRNEAGKETVHRRTVDLGALSRDAAALVEPAARKRGLELSLRLPAEPVAIETDADKVHQILLNLLSNAVKFTDAGRVELELRLDRGHVILEVRDTGTGIAPSDLDRIFEPFVQVDSSATRRYGGSGLGLAVSRDLASLLGGDLTVRSAPGRGSAFALRLPAAVPQHDGQAGEALGATG